MKNITMPNYIKRVVTLDELKQAVKEQIAKREMDDVIIHPDGWIEECNNAGDGTGSYTMNIDNEVVVKFKDKYGNIHTGICYCFDFDSDLGLGVSVRTCGHTNYFDPDRPMLLNCGHYRIGLKSITVLEGTMPATPAKPMF